VLAQLPLVVIPSVGKDNCRWVGNDNCRYTKLDGAAEAKLIAMRLGKPPGGYGHWTLQLLADELVALEVVDSISHETVRKTLKKMA
jgi:Homeodomain-like domain